MTLEQRLQRLERQVRCPTGPKGTVLLHIPENGRDGMALGLRQIAPGVFLNVYRTADELTDAELERIIGIRNPTEEQLANIVARQLGAEA